jgi:hypothetical protein
MAAKMASNELPPRNRKINEAARFGYLFGGATVAFLVFKPKSRVTARWRETKAGPAGGADRLVPEKEAAV